MRPSSGRRAPSTIPTSLRWSFTPTDIATGSRPGDPRYAAIEAALAPQPPIAVPAITIDGDADGVNPGAAHHAKKFAGPHQHRIFKGAGHNLPQERPEEWARAVIDARAMAKS